MEFLSVGGVESDVGLVGSDTSVNRIYFVCGSAPATLHLR